MRLCCCHRANERGPLQSRVSAVGGDEDGTYKVGRLTGRGLDGLDLGTRERRLEELIDLDVPAQFSQITRRNPSPAVQNQVPSR